MAAWRRSDLRRLPNDMARPSQALGVLGMTGFTAWWGLAAIGQPTKAITTHPFNTDRTARHAS